MKYSLYLFALLAVCPQTRGADVPRTTYRVETIAGSD
jgi:hypothetical protein